MAVITTGSHPKALWPGIREWFGVKYAEKPLQYEQVFETMASDKAYEEDAESTSFGLAPVKAEGAALAYDDHNQTNVAKYVNVTYGLGYKVTMEELQDNKYAQLSMARAGALAFSMRQSKEIVGSNILNRAFNASYTGPDGASLIATNHPTRAGNQSNELATPADLSEGALEDLLVQIRQAKNSRGLLINLIGQKLVVPSALVYEAKRLTGSELRPGTADNDINATRALGALPAGTVVNDYLTDNDAWFITTDVDAGLKHYQRMELSLEQENDFDTKNACASAIERYAFGWSDYRALFGSQGAP